MMRNLMMAFSIILVLSPLFLTACENDIGEIENQNFATAIGVDYRDGEYYVYIQMLGLSSVAKVKAVKKHQQRFMFPRQEEKRLSTVFLKLITLHRNVFYGHM